MNKAHEMLVAYIKAHPEETYSSIALMLGTTTPTITRICQQAGLPSRGGKRLTVDAIEKLEAK
jgi:DNA-binding MurR/RpiR family transcriptional regulator